MDISGEHRIPAPREAVWRALNDPAVLQRCIPGCKSLEKLSDTAFKGIVAAKVGPVSATFAGDVTLSDLDPPKSCILTGKGQGGAAGFASGSVKVGLREDGSDTVLTYLADARIGGKLAQLGSRLVEGTMKKMAAEFFTTFSAIVGAPAPAEAEAVPAAAAPAPGAGGGVSPWIWAGLLLVVVALLLWYFSS